MRHEKTSQVSFELFMPKSHSLIKPCASLSLLFSSPTQAQHLSQKPIQVCEPNYRTLTLLSFWRRASRTIQNYCLGGTRLFNATVSSSRPRLPSLTASLRLLSSRSSLTTRRRLQPRRAKCQHADCVQKHDEILQQDPLYTFLSQTCFANSFRSTTVSAVLLLCCSLKISSASRR